MVSPPKGAAPEVICSMHDKSYFSVTGSLTRRIANGGTRNSFAKRYFSIYERNDGKSNDGTTTQVFPRYISVWRTYTSPSFSEVNEECTVNVVEWEKGQGHIALFIVEWFHKQSCL